jgi:hypothetical protein
MRLQSDLKRRGGRSGSTINGWRARWFEANLRAFDSSHLNIAHLALVSGIGYIDFRYGDAADWRAERPHLSTWVNRGFEERVLPEDCSDASAVVNGHTNLIVQPLCHMPEHAEP